MSEVDWTAVAEVFGDALELTPAERAAFVRARCDGRPELLAAVERMLAADASVDPDFLDSVDTVFVEAAVHEASAPPERVGPWRLVREIGRGGMGHVFLAERADGQFEQQVAVKLLKRGMDSEAILARFLRERQILAGLDHPNIARLLDGGIAEDHRPYFVMENVDGEPITAYADARRLSVDERLTLFRTVCQAVEHAHRNLVVHRDLKPSNILVTRDGRPKLLDFGIAKLLTPAAGGVDTPTLTTDDVRLMTPAYAAPEQFAGGPVTTSTDVYGLGAVLYELLSGRQPFAGHRDRFTLPTDTEPITLSSAVRRAPGAEGAAPPEALATARSTDPDRLRRRLSGDLETIVAAALRAAPERRYASVEALDEDLRRHQERLPVRARPDTIGYRASRFARRHRVAVGAAGAIVTLALAFGVTATIQARALAVERDRARREAAAAREVSEFLVGVFEVADPMTPGGGDSIRATDLLERGALRIDSDLAGQPALQARMLGVIGRAYDNLRQGDRAEPLLARAVELQRASGEADGPATVSALHQLAVARANRAEYGEAEAALREAMAIQAGIEPEGSAMWSLLVDLAHVLHGTGDNDAGQDALSEAMAIFARLPDDGSGETRGTLFRMTSLLGFGSDRAKEDSVFARLTEIERLTAGEGSARYAGALTSWARARTRHGELAAADSLIERAVGILRSLDSTSLALAGALADQASIALRHGDAERAVHTARSAVRIYRTRLGEEHRQVAFARTTLADALRQVGQVDESIETHRLVLRTLAREPEDAILIPPSQWRLAVTLRDAGRVEEAAAEFESALRRFEATFPDDYLLTANARRDYGDLLVDLGRASEAEPMLRSAIDVLGTRWGAEDVRADIPRISLARALIDLGRPAEAEEVLRPALDRLTAGRGADDEWTKRAREALERLERPRAP